MQTPTPPTFLYSSLCFGPLRPRPRPRSRTHGSALPEGGPPLWSPRRARLAEPARRCADSPPDSVQQCTPPPQHSAHPVTRPAGRAAPHPPPPPPPPPPRARVEPRALPGTNLSGGEHGGASRVHEARDRRRPRSPPRRGDSSRFGFTTARPVPSPPTPARPAGSQRHVTTGAAEGQSRARAGGRGRRAGRAAGPAARGPSPAPSAPSRAARGPRLRCHGFHRPDFSGTGPAQVSPTLCPSRRARIPGRPRGRTAVTRRDPASLARALARALLDPHPPGRPPPLLRPPGPLAAPQNTNSAAAEPGLGARLTRESRLLGSSELEKRKGPMG